MEYREPTISVKNLDVIYDHNVLETLAVDDVSLDVYDGEVTVIMGKSGCGKSSLLNTIGGIKKPNGGDILFRGSSIIGYSDSQLTDYRKDKIGFVFQNYNLMESLTVLENVEVASALSKDHYNPIETLKLVGMEGMESKYPKHLSGGEKQRVCIARAIVKKAEVLLCDEPTGALDTHNSKNIAVLLQNIAKKQKISVLIVTHNPDFLKIADHYIIMENGQIIDEEVNDHPENAEDVF